MRQHVAVDHGVGFGGLLRQLRESAGMTQEELAARAGLSSKAVSLLERGERRRPYAHTVTALADALDLEPATARGAGRRGAAAADPGARHELAGAADAPWSGVTGSCASWPT